MTRINFITSRFMASWPLWHAALPIITDYNKNEAITQAKCIRRYA